jgi:hypothetical protein
VTTGGKPEVLEEKPVAMKLCPPHITHTTLGANPRLCDKKLMD